MRRTLSVVLLLTAAFASARAQAPASGTSQQRTLLERLGYPPDTKLLIVHGDDLGMAHSVDAATEKALGRTDKIATDLRASTNRPVSGIRQSLICINAARPWKIGFDGNLDIYDVRQTLAHEIGHAIGLDHPGATGGLSPLPSRASSTTRSLLPTRRCWSAAAGGRACSRWWPCTRRRAGRRSAGAGCGPMTTLARPYATSSGSRGR